MRTLRAVSCAFVVGLSLFAATTVAHAQPAAAKAEARTRFDRGVALADEGDLDRALVEFTRAYELLPNVHVLMNIAEVQTSLGRSVEAVASFDKLLASPAGLSSAELTRAKTLREREDAKVGSITIETNVTGARIEIDGKEVATTPLANGAPLRVSSGTRVVGAVAAGHAPLRKTVAIAGKSTTEVKLDLVPLEGRLAHLEVKSSLPGATIRVNGERVATTPVAATLSFAPGSYTVEAIRNGYTPASARVDLGEGATGSVTLDPAVDEGALSQSAGGGELVIAATEPGAAVAIDGRVVGVISHVRLPLGPHALRIEKAGFLTVDRSVTITATTAGGPAAIVHPYLAPTPETRSAYESHASTVRTAGWALLLGGGAVAIGGGIATVLFTSSRSDAQDNYDATVARSQGLGKGQCDDVCLAEFDASAAKLSSAKTRQTIGIVTTGVGLGAAIGGVVLLLIADDPHKYDHVPSFTPLAGGGGAIQTGGTF